MTFFDSISDVIDHGYRAVAVDMPIGLPSHTARISELQARRYLSPRGSTVFPTPVRACLDATDYADACRLSVAARGFKISKQSWHILAKIAELDRAITPAHSGRVIEAYPECSFAAMNGDRPLVSKHSVAGIDHRLQLIRREFHLEPSWVGPTKLDDVLDAYAMLWTAERFAHGEHRTFPDGEFGSATFDGRGFADADRVLTVSPKRTVHLRCTLG